MSQHTESAGRSNDSNTLPTVVATLVSPIERIHIDSAASGAYQTVHRNSIDEVMHDLRTSRANAVLLSVARYDSASSARMADMVREFPRVPAFALLTDSQSAPPHLLFSLGQLGVRSLIDARQRGGWTTLRTLIAHENANDIQRQLLATLTLDLATAPADCWRLFELIVAHRPHIVHVRQLARLLNVGPTTLVSRFYRAGLPSAKKYIDVIRLVRAARLLENPGFSISTVTRQLDYSSPQAFSRHVRMVMHMTPRQLRMTHSGVSMLQFFREQLITPYSQIFQHFHPCRGRPPWIRPPGDHDVSG